MFQSVESSQEYAIGTHDYSSSEDIPDSERGRHLQAIGDALAHGAEKITKKFKKKKNKKNMGKQDDPYKTSTKPSDYKNNQTIPDTSKEHKSQSASYIQQGSGHENMQNNFPHQTYPNQNSYPSQPPQQHTPPGQPLYNVVPDYPPGYSPDNLPYFPPTQYPVYPPSIQPGPGNLPPNYQPCPVHGHALPLGQLQQNGSSGEYQSFPMGPMNYNPYSYSNQPPQVYPPYFQHFDSNGVPIPEPLACPHQNQPQLQFQPQSQPQQQMNPVYLQQNGNHPEGIQKINWLKEGHVEEVASTFNLIGSHEPKECGGRIIYEIPCPIDREVQVSADIFATPASGFCTTFTFLPRYDIPAKGQNFDEIAFEIPCRDEKVIEWIYSNNGRKIESGQYKDDNLGKDFVRYEIKFRGGEYLKFIVNGQEIKCGTTNIPTTPMRLAFSLWRPDNDWAGRVKAPCCAKSIIKNVFVNY